MRESLENGHEGAMPIVIVNVVTGRCRNPRCGSDGVVNVFAATISEGFLESLGWKRAAPILQAMVEK